jgi:hypothetical protein
MHAEKKEGKMNTSSPFQRRKWSSPSVLLHRRGNSYSSQSICNNLDSSEIYKTTIFHLKVLKFKILHAKLSFMKFTDST